jgi:putative hydrolase of the HAD superfamily
MVNKILSLVEIMRKYMKPLKPLEAGLKAGGALRNRVRAVLFDLYGTIFISSSGDISIEERDICNKKDEKLEKLNILLHNYAIRLNSEEVFKDYLEEISRVHSRLKSEGIEYPEVGIEVVWMQVLGMEDLDSARRFAVEYESVFNPVWPMPYLRETLECLREKGILLGIISNAQFFTPLLFQAFFNATPEELGFERDLIFFSYQYRQAKPSGYLFEEAKRLLLRWSIDPTQALYVGNDMLNDVLPAHRAGFQTALFAGDLRSLRLREDNLMCRSVKPDLVITGLQNLTEYINKEYGE